MVSIATVVFVSVAVFFPSEFRGVRSSKVVSSKPLSGPLVRSIEPFSCIFVWFVTPLWWWVVSAVFVMMCQWRGLYLVWATGSNVFVRQERSTIRHVQKSRTSSASMFYPTPDVPMSFQIATSTHIRKQRSIIYVTSCSSQSQAEPTRPMQSNKSPGLSSKVHRCVQEVFLLVQHTFSQNNFLIEGGSSGMRGKGGRMEAWTGSAVDGRRKDREDGLPFASLSLTHSSPPPLPLLPSLILSHPSSIPFQSPSFEPLPPPHLPSRLFSLPLLRPLSSSLALSLSSSPLRRRSLRNHVLKRNSDITNLDQTLTASGFDPSKM